jgi:hypothetical protein
MINEAKEDDERTNHDGPTERSWGTVADERVI